MAKKNAVIYACQSCGASHQKWNGKCESCGEWNSLVEEVMTVTPGLGRSYNDNKILAPIGIQTLDDNIVEIQRINTGIDEFNRVLGGGFVVGSAILLGGDPGIGKSTLLLQAVVALSRQGYNCLYLSGEESVSQIKLRAQRLQVKGVDVKLGTATSLSDILKLINNTQAPDVLVIDSIQTIFHEGLDSAPGTVAQVRACSFELIRVAKQRNIILILVGHVTKEGNIAGPKVVEHMVDTVLYFEGERGHQFRIVRAVKNRFGAANEIGVFEMADTGLMEVANPSSIFLPSRESQVSGSCIFAGLEGTRPVLLEIQALVVPSFLATPRRAVVGWDSNRLAMMIAVLNARFGINLLDKEVYLNVAGGLRIVEPAADLAVIAALISAAKNIPLDREQVFLGEVGLSGELRQVVHTDIRLNEAHKLGFKKAYIPFASKKNACKIGIISVNHIRELDKLF